MTEKKKSNLALLAIICCVICLMLGVLYGLQHDARTAVQSQLPGVPVGNSPDFSIIAQPSPVSGGSSSTGGATPPPVVYPSHHGATGGGTGGPITRTATY